MNMETVQQALHYEAMAVGLALAASKPRSCLYVQVDDALMHQDWDFLRDLWGALRTLPAHEQSLLRGRAGNPMQLGEAVSHLEASFYIQAAWQPESGSA